MHRSGTSAVTGLLVRLGARAPKTLMRPTAHNPLGFWESDAFFDYHERLLRTAGTDWDEWTHASFDVLDATTVARFTDEWRGLLQQEFGDAPLFAVKDPRICRFVPFWLGNLAAHGIEAAAVITVRTPLEVAQSLAVRDGLGTEHALMLWLRHMLDAEWATRSIARSFVGYQDLLVDWKSAGRQTFEDIGVDWPDDGYANDAEISAFLKPELRHHAVGIEQLSAPAPLGDWVEQTDAAFARLLTRDPESPHLALRMLDDVRSDVDRFTTVFGPIFSSMRRAERQRSSTLEREVRQHALNAETERDRLRQHALDVETERDRLRQYASEVETERDRLHACASARDAELAGVRSHALRVEQERDELARQLVQTRTDNNLTIGSLTQELAESETRVRALLQSRSWRWAAPLRAAFGVWLKVSARATR